MLRQVFFRVAIFIWCALFGALVYAATTDDDEEKPWVEGAVQMPAFPEDKDLVAFTVGSVSDRQYFIDASTVSVGNDGVVRFVLIVLSSAGARNVSFEGMRCATAERRSYAFGRPDRTWSIARGNKWLKIQGSTNNHYVELFSAYFCKIGAPVLATDDDVRRVLKSGGAGRF